MIWIVISIVLVIGAVVFFYQMGKRVKEKEKQFEAMFKEEAARNNLRKYKRKSTPKVPTIKK